MGKIKKLITGGKPAIKNLPESQRRQIRRERASWSGNYSNPTGNTSSGAPVKGSKGKLSHTNGW